MIIIASYAIGVYASQDKCSVTVSDGFKIIDTGRIDFTSKKYSESTRLHAGISSVYRFVLKHAEDNVIDYIGYFAHSDKPLMMCQFTGAFCWEMYNTFGMISQQIYIDDILKHTSIDRITYNRFKSKKKRDGIIEAELSSFVHQLTGDYYFIPEVFSVFCSLYNEIE